jgi:protoporphyrinogen oxidase
VSRVGIVGGGPAGLALAHDLARSGHEVALFEAAPELGGLARSFRLGEISIERYYHFLCADDTGYYGKLAELGMAGELRWRPTTMGFFYQGRLYPFSSARDLLAFDGISLAGRLRYGAAVFYLSHLRNWRRLDPLAAEPWLLRLLGREAYMATWYPLLKVKFDRHHDRISAAWVWHRVRRVARSRKSPFHRERLGHLRGGTETLVDALEADLRRRGVELRTATPVERILIEDGRAAGLLVDGARHEFDAVVAAVPLPHFLRLAPDLPAAYRDALGGIEFLGVACVVLRLARPLTGNFWLNVNDPRIPFNGCIEYTNLNPAMTPDGSSVLYVPFYLPRDHPRFRAPDEELCRECLAALALIRPGLDERGVLAWAVSRDPYAQVVCTTGFAGRVPGHETPVEGLYLVESSQLYPSDRTISGTIDLAGNVARRIGGAG